MPPNHSDYIETVFTCKGDFYDPDFPHQLEVINNKLLSLLKADKEELVVKKVEPWNSVKVTLNLPRDAAQRLKALANQNDGAALRSVGIMSLQVEGDRIISLKLSSSGNVTPNPGLSQQPSREPVSDSLLGNLFQSTSNRATVNPPNMLAPSTGCFSDTKTKTAERRQRNRPHQKSKSVHSVAKRNRIKTNADDGSVVRGSHSSDSLSSLSGEKVSVISHSYLLDNTLPSRLAMPLNQSTVASQHVVSQRAETIPISQSIIAGLLSSTPDSRTPMTRPAVSGFYHPRASVSSAINISGHSSFARHVATSITCATTTSITCAVTTSITCAETTAPVTTASIISHKNIKNAPQTGVIRQHTDSGHSVIRPVIRLPTTILGPIAIAQVSDSTSALVTTDNTSSNSCSLLNGTHIHQLEGGDNSQIEGSIVMVPPGGMRTQGVIVNKSETNSTETECSSVSNSAGTPANISSSSSAQLSVIQTAPIIQSGLQRLPPRQTSPSATTHLVIANKELPSSTHASANSIGRSDTVLVPPKPKESDSTRSWVNRSSEHSSPPIAGLSSSTHTTHGDKPSKPEPPKESSNVTACLEGSNPAATVSETKRQEPSVSPLPTGTNARENVGSRNKSEPVYISVVEQQHSSEPSSERSSAKRSMESVSVICRPSVISHGLHALETFVGPPISAECAEQAKTNVNVEKAVQETNTSAHVKNDRSPAPSPAESASPSHSGPKLDEPCENGSSTSTDSGVVAGSPKSDLCATPPYDDQAVKVELTAIPEPEHPIASVYQPPVSVVIHSDAAKRNCTNIVHLRAGHTQPVSVISSRRPLHVAPAMHSVLLNRQQSNRSVSQENVSCVLASAKPLQQYSTAIAGDGNNYLTLMQTHGVKTALHTGVIVGVSDSRPVEPVISSPLRTRPIYNRPRCEPVGTGSPNVDTQQIFPDKSDSAPKTLIDKPTMLKSDPSSRPIPSAPITTTSHKPEPAGLPCTASELSHCESATAKAPSTCDNTNSAQEIAGVLIDPVVPSVLTNGRHDSPEPTSEEGSPVPKPELHSPGQRKSGRVKTVKSPSPDPGCLVKTGRKRSRQSETEETLVCRSKAGRPVKKTPGNGAQEENGAVMTTRSSKRSTRSSGLTDLQALPTVYRERKRNKR